MPAFNESELVVTASEAKVLDRGRRAPKFIPRDEPTQLIVCRLVDRGLMTINGPLWRDNRCFTTLKGGFALATWAAKRSRPLSPREPMRREGRE